MAANEAMDVFTKRLETWFDDTMNRVSGRYKRRVQFILFAIGIPLAFILNIDSIEIAGKLSKKKDLRAQMVQLAIQAPEKFKNDARVKESATTKDSTKVDDMLDQYKQKFGDVKKMLTEDKSDMTKLLASGWADKNIWRSLSLTKFFGFLLTAFAISLGAPF